MRSGFIAFGALLALSSGLDLAYKNQPPVAAAALSAYGVSMVLTGIFSAAPFLEGVSFSESEAKLHGVFASVAGLSLSASMFASAVASDQPGSARWLHGGALGLTVACSAMFMLDPEHQGVWQRLLWTVGLGWISVSASF